MGLQLAGRLPDVNLHVFTEPPLDDEDAMLMLATGSTGAELAQGGIVGKTLASGGEHLRRLALHLDAATGGSRGRRRSSSDSRSPPTSTAPIIASSTPSSRSTDRFYLHVQRDRFESTNLGLIWRIRFR